MKVGDRVKIVGTIYDSEELSIGKEGVISLVYHNNYMYEILLDSGHTSSDGDPFWPFFGSELEVV